jgi:hypothetical protein
MSEMPEFTEAQILRVQSGDVVVFRIAGTITMDMALRIREQAERVLKVPVLVTNALSIDVIRAEVTE